MEENLSARDYIIEAYFLLLRKRKTDEITIKDICDKAGVSRVTFYRNFKDKMDIIDGYFTKMIREFVIELGVAHKNDYYNVAYHTFYVLRQEKENIKALINSKLEHLYLNTLNEKILANFIEEGYGDSITSYAYSGALFNISMWWVRDDDCKTSIETMVKTFFNICKFDTK